MDIKSLMEDIPPSTTLPPEQAGDFLDNMVLAIKDGNLKEWCETISLDHAEKVRDTLKDMTVVNESNAKMAPAISQSVECFIRCVQRIDREGGDIKEARICGHCAATLADAAAHSEDYLRENATPQLQKLFSFVDDLKKQAIAQAPAMLEQMAQMMAQELGLDIKEARAQVGLTEDGKRLLRDVEAEKKDTDNAEEQKDSPTNGWSAGLE